MTQQQGTLRQHQRVTRAAVNYPRKKAVVQGTVGKGDGTPCKEVCMYETWPKYAPLPEHMGTTSFLSSVSGVGEQECPLSCHPLPGGKAGLRRYWSAFKFYTGFMQLSLVLLSWDRSHKHVHAHFYPVQAGGLHPTVQGPPRSPAGCWVQLASLQSLFSLSHPLLSAKYLLACRAQGVLEYEWKQNEQEKFREDGQAGDHVVCCL